MTDTPSAPSPATDTWDGMLAALRSRYPGQKDSVLFCIHKLQQNPDLSLRDFRDEAQLYGIPMAGRALHSARVLLGLQAATPTAPRNSGHRESAASPTRLPTGTDSGRVRRTRRDPGDEPGTSIETQVLDAVRKIQSAAGEDAQRLRTAIRQAVQILQRALGE